MFEVETLKYATLATVSRCGMVWYSSDLVDYQMIFFNYLSRLMQDNYDEVPNFEENKPQEQFEHKIRTECVNAIRPLFE